jgi:glycosyltransferase involved in cell wall biosynthesis
MKVVFFNRKPRALGNYSVESYFKQIRENLPPTIEAVYLEMPFESNGLWRRLANALYCMFHQGDVNHITGDVNYVAIFLKRRKTILTFLDCGNLHQSKGIKHYLVKLIWYKLPISKSQHLTAISQATKKDLLHFTDCIENKISVIYVSINERFTYHPNSFNTVTPRILHIGTAPNKNLERLIPALKDISCKLVIVGKINTQLNELIKFNKIDCECIETRLSDQEILDEYIKCDILSLVSTVEGFGMPIIEANAVGRPVITSTTTSMPEIADNAAILVNPWDINSIRDGFLLITQDQNLRNQLIENGLKNQRRFQPKKLAQEYVDLYKKILAKT